MQTWDPYTRIWHWLLMFGIIFQYISGEILDDQIQNHALVGYGLLGMMTFRVLWGVIGPETIRFATFIPTPTHLLTYITGKQSTPYATHNPLGALAVLGFIVIIFIQSLSFNFKEALIDLDLFCFFRFSISFLDIFFHFFFVRFIVIKF